MIVKRFVVLKKVGLASPGFHQNNAVNFVLYLAGIKVYSGQFFVLYIHLLSEKHNRPLCPLLYCL